MGVRSDCKMIKIHDSTVSWLEAGLLTMTTRAEARAKRERELREVAKAVKEYTLPPEMDEDARALYWVGPWDYRRYVKDEKGRYKKDDKGNPAIKIERDPMPAIHIHLGAFKSTPRALFRRRSGLHVAGPHRCLGFLEAKKLLTTRVYQRNWHPRLHGWTVNLHILRNANRFGFDAMEINGKSYTVECLLTCPEVPRKESGGYEKNLLLVDPENEPKQTISPPSDQDPDKID
jgi:hypothetical protein